ncbi:MAG: DUF1287 domain-containing protein [Verrucomicrobiota bacterium]
MKRFLLVLALSFVALSNQTKAQDRSKDDLGLEIVASAREQIGTTIRYDPSYQRLDYPAGDIPMERGVCTDVVIRALRAGCDSDLQVLVNEDMKHHFPDYPQNWKLTGPDKNIDHRRVPNLKTFFKRKRLNLSISRNPSDYQPGDLVTCLVPPHLPHIMIVSDKKSKSGIPYVIHNIGRGTVEENRLFDFEITGHYRIKSIQHLKK